jgi:hypothetical protein
LATDDDERKEEESPPDEAPEDESDVEDEPAEDETPEVDERDTRIAELEAVVGELTAALEAANERVAELSAGLIKVSGDVDQDARDEVTPPAPNLLSIMKEFT